MILIADSGSTKTDWALVEDGNVYACIATCGINPVHIKAEDVEDILRNELLPGISGFKISRVCYYGAGCRGHISDVMRDILSRVLRLDRGNISVDSDLMAAARALCGNREGIACILGTGSNSCLYNGKEITANIPPLGYILGDEGSGAVLGSMFLNAIFKDTALADMRDDYLHWSGLDYPAIINRVYRQPMANRFLASISLYISEHKEHPAIRSLIKENFRAFFRNNIARYGCNDLPVNAVGGIAFAYRELFAETACEEGFVIGKVIKSPLQGLVEYYSEK